MNMHDDPQTEDHNHIDATGTEYYRQFCNH
jgi:hypothetical protein